MSNLFDYHDEERSPWGKLHTYLNFRQRLQGLWVKEKISELTEVVNTIVMAQEGM